MCVFLFRYSEHLSLSCPVTKDQLGKRASELMSDIFQKFFQRNVFSLFHQKYYVYQPKHEHICLSRCLMVHLVFLLIDTEHVLCNVCVLIHIKRNTI